MEIWVVKHEHRHGTNVYIHSDEGMATKRAIRLVGTWFEEEAPEACDAAGEVLGELGAAIAAYWRSTDEVTATNVDVVRVLDCWTEYQDNFACPSRMESIETTQATVDDEDSAVSMEV